MPHVSSCSMIRLVSFSEVELLRLTAMRLWHIALTDTNLMFTVKINGHTSNTCSRHFFGFMKFFVQFSDFAEIFIFVGWVERNN